MIEVEKTLAKLQAEWEEVLDLEKRRLLRELFSAAYVRGNALVAVQPAERFHPLVNIILDAEKCFYCGSDGYRPLLSVS